VSREVTLRQDLPSATSRCRDILRSLGEERPGDPVEVGAIVEAVTAAGKRSVGNVVRAELKSVPGGTQILVASWPGAQLFDWGESKRLVSLVCSQLKNP
jgi:hypothetical protein